MTCGEGHRGAEGSLFGALFTTDAMSAATSDRSWARAMLDFEAALARVEARAGVIPSAAGAAIEACCARYEDFDVAELGRAGRLSGNPGAALVAFLREQLPAEAAPWAHFGATSQDVVDTALMLVLGQALDLVLADLGEAEAAAADLAERHRATPMVARTLLQHALPTTFGVKAAGWLAGLVEARLVLERVRKDRLALQLGGPAGNLSGLGEQAFGVVEGVASVLGLLVPALPWHTERTRVAEAASALLLAAGVAGKIALDVTLLMQTEVGEVSEPWVEGRGSSSSMPHKRNPSMATLITACWSRAQGLASVLVGAMAQEHERAAGAWQAEASTLSELCRTSGGAVSVVAELLGGLEVHPDRMTANLALAGHGGGQAVVGGVRSAEVLVDRALSLYRERPPGA